jgi:hypothetical protein
LRQSQLELQRLKQAFLATPTCRMTSMRMLFRQRPRLPTQNQLLPIKTCLFRVRLFLRQRVESGLLRLALGFFWLVSAVFTLAQGGPARYHGSNGLRGLTG